MPAIDKLSVCNSAMVRTGNVPFNVPDDGSDAWIVASQVYEDALPVVLSLRDWNFQTAIVALTRTGDSAFPGYADVFAKPADCLQLQAVWRTDVAALYVPVTTYLCGPGDLMTRPPALDYRIIGDAVHTVAPAGVTGKYMREPFGDLTGYPALFAETLKLQVSAGLALGLNEDQGAASAFLKLADEMVDLAAAREDQQEPRRALFRSRFLERRRGAAWR
jgi:hypothetical protein